MATITVPQIQNTTNGDTVANANTLVLRDAQGGIAANVIIATSLQTTGTIVGEVSNQTADFTAASATDYFVDATSGAVVVTLPLASASTGVIYHVWKTDASGNTVTLTGALGYSVISSQYDSGRFVSDGVNWYGAAL